MKKPSIFLLLLVGSFVLWMEMPSLAFQFGDFCTYPKDAGRCTQFKHRFFYNSSAKKCETFLYGGCQGNLNRFITIEECQRSCGRIEKPGSCLPSPQDIRTECIADCLHDGNCPKAQKCCSYGCALRCFDPVQDICRLPPETGPCHNFGQRWFYNWPSRKCEQFTYGGCAGNKNNFQSSKECRQRCPKDIQRAGMGHLTEELKASSLRLTPSDPDGSF